MNPYSDFTYFALLLYVVVPTVALGLIGRAGWRWALLVTVVMLLFQYRERVTLEQNYVLREIWLVAGFALWQWATVTLFACAGARGGWPFYLAITASLLPLVLAKVVPVLAPGELFGFLGISYITFRALDVVFCLRDEVIATPGLLDFLAFLFFFPTISAGPIDRYRRFHLDWKTRRTRADFVRDLDGAVHHVFRGFFYKFILAALIEEHWMKAAAAGWGFWAEASYAYAYSLYLFFDFAGYSAFAIGFSHLFGIHTPENFSLPFIARNIRDFWNRWHITLSFWFRDHIYMRFLLAATKGKWFQGKNTASSVALFVTFGLMGLWHGTQIHYLVYGAYHATLLSSYDAFSRWNKKRKLWGEGRWWRIVSIVLTFHAVTFGLLIFSGRLTRHPPQSSVPQLEQRPPAR